MRDKFEPATQETAYIGLAELGLRLERTIAQVEDFAGIGLASQESLLRQRHAGDVGEGIFAHASAAAKVGEETGGVLDRIDGERHAVPGGDGLAHTELHAFQHGRAEGVEPIFSAGGKFDADAFRRRIDARNHAEPQFRFPLTHTTLANDT